MQDSPEKGIGPVTKLAPAFCSVVEFLSETKILGVSVGFLIFLASLFAFLSAYRNLESVPYAFLFIIVVVVGQVAHFLICNQKGLGNHLLETGIRLASLGAGWLISYAFFDLNSFSGVFPILVAPFVGDGIYALYRKW